METFYLAHNWENRFEVRIIQKYLEKYFNIKLINPFYNSPQEEKMIDRDFADVIEKKYGSGSAIECYKVDSELSLSKSKEYRQDDLKAIRQSDGLICILLDTDRAIGSIKEIFYAYEQGKIVYLICSDKRFTCHMWHFIEVTQPFETIMDFIKFLKETGRERK